MQYGPLYRIETDHSVASLQVQSKEIWGTVGRNNKQGLFPRVRAYTNEPEGEDVKGIKFMTDVLPDPNTPPQFAFWSGNRPGVLIEMDTLRSRPRRLNTIHDF